MVVDPVLITTKIPHHSQHSGYEQLIKYIPKLTIRHFDRGHANSFFKLSIERMLRRFSASRWYQWDGVLGDIEAVKHLNQANSIVHFLYGDSSIGLVPYLKNYIPGKLVLTIHACPTDMDDVLQYPHMLKAVDALVLLGSTQKQYFLDLGFEESKLHVIPHGVDRTFFKPILNKPVQHTLQVLLVGNWRRNFHLYEKVIKQSEGLNILFHVVTPTFNHHHFRGLKQIKLYTHISDESLRSMYQLSDILLMGMTDAVANNVLLEAAVCGLPIICEKVGAVEDYFSNEAVTYVEPHDDQAIVRCFRAVLKNRTLLLAKAEQASKEVEQFDWQTIGRRTNEVYQSLYENKNT